MYLYSENFTKMKSLIAAGKKFIIQNQPPRIKWQSYYLAGGKNTGSFVLPSQKVVIKI